MISADKEGGTLIRVDHEFNQFRLVRKLSRALTSVVGGHVYLSDQTSDSLQTR